MKLKKIWELYKELRSLRRKVKVLEEDLHRANMRYNTLFYKKSQEVPYNTMSVVIPNVHYIEALGGYRCMDSRPRADYIHEKMTDKMKIKLVDDLFEQGYIRKVQDDDVGEVYEIKVVS
jgi:hypothetical protein